MKQTFLLIELASKYSVPLITSKKARAGVSRPCLKDHASFSADSNLCEEHIKVSIHVTLGTKCPNNLVAGL